MSLWDRWKRWGAAPAPQEAPRSDGPPPDEAGLREALRGVVDPEVGVDIVSMGLIRQIAIEDGQARVDMTLSTRGCPVGDLLVGEVEAVIREAGLQPEVALVWDPPWSPADMDPAAARRIR